MDIVKRQQPLPDLNDWLQRVRVESGAQQEEDDGREHPEVVGSPFAGGSHDDLAIMDSIGAVEWPSIAVSSAEGPYQAITPVRPQSTVGGVPARHRLSRKSPSSPYRASGSPSNELGVLPGQGDSVSYAGSESTGACCIRDSEN